MEKNMEYKVKEETINKILNYLATKPYVEVAGLIQVLQTVKPIKEDKVEHKS